MYLPCLGLKADKKPRLYRLTCTLRLRDLFVSSQWVLFHFLIYCHLSTIVDLSWFWRFATKLLGLQRIYGQRPFQNIKNLRKSVLAWKYHFRHCNGGYHGRLFNKQTFSFFYLIIVSNKKKNFSVFVSTIFGPFSQRVGERYFDLA